MRTKLLKLVSIFIIILISTNIIYARVSASVSKTHLEKGETFELILHLEDFDTQPDLDVLDKDFTVYNTSTSSKTTTIDGQRKSNFDMVVTLMPNKVGKLTIPSIQVGNQSTKPIEIEVDKALSNEEQSKYQDLFAIGSLATNTTYVNVPVLYTLRLYYSTPILNLEPKPFDIKKSEIRQTNHRITYQKRINGELYDVVEESFLIIPQSTGLIKIPSIVLEATTPNIFGQLGTKKKYFSTDPKYLTVRPIPQDISIKDWFPASDVQISDNWSQSADVKEGELLTRTVEVKAKGVLSNDIPKLEFDSSDAFNVYAEKPELQDIEKNGNLTGVAIYKIGYMPIKQGRSYIPAVKLKWFDIDSHKSKVAAVAAKTFDVHKGNIAESNFVPSNKTRTKIITKIIKDPFWKVVALVFALLWIITLALLLKCKFSKARNSKNMLELNGVEVSEKTLGLKDIKKACSSKNNLQLQKAIISWANTLSDRQLFSLLEIANIFPELFDLLRKLNASIYANKEFTQYKELLDLIRKATKTKKTKPDKLIKGLYE